MPKAIERAAPGARPTLGVIVSELGPLLYQTQWLGVADAAMERGANVICFAGGLLRSPVGFQAQANVLYDLIDTEKLDGLIIWSGALDWFVQREEMEAFCKRYASIPVVSMETPIRGLPSILMDNYQGMRDAVEHLIQAHGYRRIACLRGPEGHAGAQERYRAYVEALAAHGLPFEPRLVSPPGTWAPQEGAAMVRLLLDERQLRPGQDFQALVVVNDTMALSALAAFEARGLHVPNDVAIVGFDDEAEASTLTPPLTTVRQPFYQAARQAVDIVLAAMRGEQAPEQVIVPTRMVVRQSCGCPSPAAQAAAAPAAAPVGNLDAMPPAQRQAILTEAAHTGCAPEQVERLLEAWSKELKGESPGGLASTLSEILRQAAREPGDPLVWQGAISALRRGALPYLADAAARQRAEDLWGQARVLIGEAAQRQAASQKFAAERQARTLNDISQALITTFDIAALMDTVAQQLPRLDIPGCYISLYQNPQTPGELAELILAYNEKGRIEPEQSKLLFPTRQLAPADLCPHDRPYSLVVEPLYFQDNQIGLLALEAGPRHGLIYETLRGQLSSALKGTLLVQQVEKRAYQIRTAAEVSRAASGILDPDELLQQVVNLAQRRFDLYYAGLFLVDHAGEWTSEPGKWAVLRAGTGQAGQKMLERKHKLEIGGTSMIGWCIANKQARIALDVGQEAVRFENPLLPETRSEMALPLVSRSQAIGAMTIQSARPGAFSAEDIATLQTMADQVANAIENARLIKQVQNSLQEAQALARASQALIGFEDIAQPLQTVVDIVVSALSADCAALTVFDLDKRQVFDFIKSGPGQNKLAPPNLDQLLDGLYGWALREQRPALSPKESPDPRESPAAQRQRAADEIGSMIVAPLLYQNKPLGVMLVANRPEQRNFTQHDVDLTMALSNQAAVALANARLLEQTQLALRDAEAVQRRYMAQAWAQYMAGAPAAEYEIGQPGSEPLGDKKLAEIQPALAQRKTAVLTGDQVAGQDHTALVAPSVVHGQIVGAIGVHAAGPRQWNEEDIAMLEAIAERMALTADNLRLLQETQERAARERLVSEAATRMRETLDVEAVLQTALQEMRQRLNLAAVEVRFGRQDNAGSQPGKHQEPLRRQNNET